MEMEKDTELVLLLAKSVLDKSQEIDEQVAALPGMDRTRSQQMDRIKELIELNKEASTELQNQAVYVHERLQSLRSTVNAMDEQVFQYAAYTTQVQTAAAA